MKLKQILSLPLLVIFLVNCNSKNNDIDTKNIKANLSTIRYDKEFYSIDTNNIRKGIGMLLKEYRDFTPLYIEQMQGWGKANPEDINTEKAIRHFLTYKDYVGLNDTIQKYYPNTKDIDAEILELIKHYKYYFPNAVSPSTLYYFNSGLNNWGCITLDDSVIGIGLDMYLGEQYPFYASVQIPNYKLHQLTKQNISVDVARNIYRNKFPFTPDGKNLLELILEKGKEQFFIDKMIPTKSDEYKIGFKKDQLDWCKQNERMIYSFFVSNKLLYSTDLQQVFRYVTEGPSTMGMPPESPGNVGSWLGWQIVNAYVKNTGANLEEILTNKLSAEKFLQKSNYKP